MVSLEERLKNITIGILGMTDNQTMTVNKAFLSKVRGDMTELVRYRSLGTPEELAALVEARGDVTMKTAYDESGIPYLITAEGAEAEHIVELLAAEKDGRYVVLPPLGEDDCAGLKGKYFVYKAKNAEPVDNCFVLRPDKDPAAVSALTAYARTTDNKQLAGDILRWIKPDEKVMVLPCKVGDTVWTNTCILGDYFRKKDKPYKCEVVFMGLSGEASGYINVVFKNGRMYQFSLHDFGKTVFLTRADAEAALAKEGVASE